MDAMDVQGNYQEENVIFSGDQKKKLIQIINEGGSVLREIDTLNEGLNETIKAIATDLNIKPSILKKAVKIAHKAEFGQAQRDHDLLTTILESTGNTL
jgi:DNA-binding MarR family transcriptional regulator